MIGTVVGGMNVYRISGSLVRAGPGELLRQSGRGARRHSEDEGYSYRMIYPKPSLLQSIVEQSTAGSAAPHFRVPVTPDPVLARRFLAAHEGCSMVLNPLASTKR